MGMPAPDRRGTVTDADRACGVRLYTRAPFTVGWLSGTVLPVVRRANGGGPDAVHVLRGWLHGTHVDVVGPDGAGIDWGAIADAWDAGPLDPDTALTEATYLDRAREFGRLENVEPPYLPVRAHGAAELLGPRPAGNGRSRLRELEEVVLRTLCRPLLSTAERMAADPSRATALLAEAYLALADTHAMGPSYGTFSFRSHAEGFFAWSSPRKDPRPAFAERLARDSAQIRPAAEQCLAGEPGPSAAQWRTAFAYCAGALDNAVAEGTLTLETLDEINGGDLTGMGPPGAPEAAPTGSEPDSEFHRTVRASGAIDTPSPWFAAYRLLLNVFYRQLPLLTVSPMQRYYMCWAVAETVDGILGQTWQERLQSTPEPVPAQRTEAGR
ncbi:hypothetical protein ACFQZ2_07545 [Streptomonospora algeriensis]|uniref:Thiopeptide-type bacteriocin biosynthesis domain-containing protein n=1 Tax=Streptomonospora algeriensis TaxID=995084 RepID=A0ABW3BEJ0_9ACTN